MKKFLRTGLLMLAGAFMLSFSAAAQDMPLPVDSEVRIGRLDNGLTYYIRHNEKPKGQADFYIAQKVGSILEEDNQRGLAHFLEHMCFNGTENFPGNGIIDWLESVGVKFGYNLNAYTSVDETVYNISNVPTDRISVQDSCLLILHDWANALLLEDEEIDKERGVIHQEWRRSMSGQMRILENLLPVMYPDSRYGYRLPIGTMEVVDNFPYQALRDYYETWYRPDQQGIVVVGDIDVDRIEAKIKEMFSDIEMPANAPERKYFEVPDTPGTIYAIGSDPEQTIAIVEVFFKTDAIPNEMKGGMMYLGLKYMTDMVSTMLGNRLDEISKDPDAPFAQAGADYGEFFLSKTKDAMTVVGVAKEGTIDSTLEAIYRELLRAQRGGFTQSEYDRARDEYMSRLESAYNNRNYRESSSYVNEYVRHFIDNEPIPSVEDEYEIMKMVVPMLPLEAINSILPEVITPDNRVVLVMMPEKEGYTLPTADGLAAIMAAVDAEDIEVYADNVKEEPLIPALPAPGKIVSEKHLDQWDATEMMLSNGVRVIVKPTTFKADEIILAAGAMGGTSSLPASDDLNVKTLALVTMDNGLGTYTSNDLSKYLAGKQATVSLSIDDYERVLSGSSTPKDLPTLFELVYMTMTDVTMEEKEFAALQNMIVPLIKNQESNPQYIFSRDVAKAIFASPRRQPMTADDVLAADREAMLKIVHDMTANAADYTFVIVGNVDLDVLRPLLEQYVATLPADAAHVVNSYVPDAALDIKDGSGVETFTTAMQTPQTYVFIAETAKLPHTSKDAKTASVAGQILSNRLLKTVREDMGAVYSIGAQASLGRDLGKNASVMSQFPMKPEMKQEVLDFIAQEFKNMESNITPDEFNPIIEFMVKSAKERKEENAAWLAAITGWLENGVDTFNNNIEEIQSITIADVQNFMKNVAAQNNYVVVVLDPEATMEEAAAAGAAEEPVVESPSQNPDRTTTASSEALEESAQDAQALIEEDAFVEF